MTDFDGFEEAAEDLEEFARRLRVFEARIPETLDRALEKTSRKVESTASINAPKDTNRLANSSFSRKEGRGRWVVGFSAEYAAPVEFGSEPHIITPNDADALHFFVDGEEVFTKRVEHPGTPAQPYLRPAMREHSNDLTKHLERELEKLAKEVFAV
jgi:HK97 gp10 family phage protein